MIAVCFALWYGVMAGVLFGYGMGDPAIRKNIDELSNLWKCVFAMAIALWPITLAAFFLLGGNENG